MQALHTCTHIHTLAQTHTHTRTHACTHTHACMHARLHAFTHAHIRTRSHEHTCMCAHTHARMHTHASACIPVPAPGVITMAVDTLHAHSRSPTYYAHMHTCILKHYCRSITFKCIARTHTCTHASTHASAHTHTRTQAHLLLQTSAQVQFIIAEKFSFYIIPLNREFLS